MLHQFHRSQLIGEMVLLLLICLLFIQFHHQALQFIHSWTPPSTYHSLPPVPSPPSPPLPAHPKRSRHPRNEWLPEQWSIPDCYKQPRKPTPAVESSDDNSSNSDDPWDLIWADAASTPEPTSFRQSQQCSDADLWQKACEEVVLPGDYIVFFTINAFVTSAVHPISLHSFALLHTIHTHSSEPIHLCTAQHPSLSFTLLLHCIPVFILHCIPLHSTIFYSIPDTLPHLSVNLHTPLFTPSHTFTFPITLWHSIHISKLHCTFLNSPHATPHCISIHFARLHHTLLHSLIHYCTVSHCALPLSTP